MYNTAQDKNSGWTEPRIAFFRKANHFRILLADSVVRISATHNTTYFSMFWIKPRFILLRLESDWG